MGAPARIEPWRATRYTDDGGRAAASVILPLCLALAGCGPDAFVGALDIATPSRFAEAAQSAPAPPPKNWLATFRSPELVRLGELARDQNLDIAAAVARIDQAEAQTRIAAAALYPARKRRESRARPIRPSCPIDNPYSG